MTFEMRSIGTVYSPYKTKEACPVHGAAAPTGQGRVEVFPEYEEALETIEGF